MLDKLKNKLAYKAFVFLLKYVDEHPTGKVTRKCGDFGGAIQGRLVTCMGIFYIKQKCVFPKDMVNVRDEYEY